MPTVQQFRMISIKTALGDGDILGLRSFAYEEQISRLFQIEAELSSDKDNINFDDVVGNTASIRLNVAKGDKRYFNGYVSRFVQLAGKAGFSHYRATIVPWLWFLTRTSDCRIFQNKKTSEIIEAVFKGHGFTDYQLKLTGTYQPKEYCVQYRETDFNFVSRLMEQEGIYYYFDHTEDGKCTLVLADSTSAHKPFPNYDEVDFRGLDKGTGDREVITDWTMAKEVQPVATALNDFDFTKPTTSLLAKDKVTRKYGKAEYEMYDYPGEYTDHGDGTRLATVRLNELQTQYTVFHGQGSARGLAAGFTFELSDHPRPDQNGEYLITSVSLQADAGEFASTGHSSGANSFSCNFTCIQKEQQFRPARLSPKPLIQGPQTAMVVGTSGQEVDPDIYGRVKVQFHWDRQGKADENSSCLIRVAQSWAGGKLRSGSEDWGDMAIPHLGDEVIVEFLEGDPDRPIITGGVYNGKNKPPFSLPDHKHVRVFRDNFGNEITMDATPGSGGMHLYSPSVVTIKSGDAGGEGKKMELSKGDSIDVINGGRNALTIGVYQDHVLGTRYATTIGGGMDVAVGIKVGVDLAQHWEHKQESNLVTGHEDLIMSARETLCLLGGAGQSETSVINASASGITLSVGEGKDVHAPDPNAAVKAIMGLLPTAHAAWSAYQAVANQGKMKSMESWNTQVITANWKRHAVLMAAYAAAWGACKVMAKTQTKPVDHDTPKGWMRLTSDDGSLGLHSDALISLSSKGQISLAGAIGGKVGNISINDNGDIMIQAGGNITLSTPGTIEFKAKDVKGPKYDTAGPGNLGSGVLTYDDSPPSAPSAPDKPEVKYQSAK